MEYSELPRAQFILLETEGHFPLAGLIQAVAILHWRVPFILPSIAALVARNGRRPVDVHWESQPGGCRDMNRVDAALSLAYGNKGHHTERPAPGPKQGNPFTFALVLPSEETGQPSRLVVLNRREDSARTYDFGNIWPELS